MEKYYRSFLTVDLSAVRHNLKEAKAKIGGKKLLAVVKTDAYGHGAVRVSEAIADLVDYYAVACLSEAVELREGGIKKPILILGYTSPKEYGELLAYNITPTVYTYDAAEKLSEIALLLGTKAKIHIAVDTGMGRIGFIPSAENADTVAKIAALPGIEIEGVFTHFAKADEADKSYTESQIAHFDWFIDRLSERGVQIPIRHCYNSAAIMDLSETKYEMVRSGIITYGLLPSAEVKKESMNLQPVMEWKAHVIHVKTLPAGCGISYGATYVTDKERRIATVSVGYGDGYPRSLSGKGRVLIHGQSAPILGRVCMDQMMVDVSDIKEVKPEDIVTLFGKDGDAFLSAEEVADLSGRFNYELVCDISMRVSKIYKQ
ncbi:MAG: alanine racemase [Lachnospiraceae bacterium]|nr:alanine racemase [Lachnospiraceae bacterium]